MGKSVRYTVYNTMNVYSDKDKALAYGSNWSSTITNTSNSVEGAGEIWVGDNWGGVGGTYWPAFVVWFMPSWGGSGYEIGWTNDSKNLGASVPTLNKSSMNTGETVTITTNRLNGAFTHTVRWRYGSGSWNTIGTGVGASTTWTPTGAQIYGALPGVERTGTFTINVVTYNGSTYVGENSKTITITVPLNVFTVSNFSVTDSDYAFPVSVSRNYTGFTSRIQLYNGSTYLGYWNISGDSATLTPANASEGNSVAKLLGQLSSVSSASFTARCATMYGTTVVSFVDKPVTISVHSSVVPSITGAVTASETNTKISSTLGLNYFVQGVSTFSVSASGTSAGTGASIISRSFKLGDFGVKSGTATSQSFGSTNLLTATLTATVTDSRGRTASKTGTITQVAYTKPAITLFKGYRNASNGALVTIDLKASQTSLKMAGVEKNTVRYKVDAKPELTGSWSSRKAFTSYQTSALNYTATAISNVANDGRWRLRVTVEDLIGTYTELEVSLPYSSLTVMRVINGESVEFLVNTKILGNLQAGAFTGLSSWANQLVGQPKSWNIHLDSSGDALLGYTNSSGAQIGTYTLTHTHPYAPTSHTHDYAPTSHTHAYAPTSHNHSGANITSGTVPVARLGMTFNNAANGRLVLPNGFILQWGRMSIASGSTSGTFSFPYAFPSGCRNIVGTWETNTAYNESYTVSFNTISKTGAKAYCKRYDGVVDFVRYVYWQAIGY